MSDVKNYGLKGVGDDVQFGKAGGRFKYATDFLFTAGDGSTLVNAQAASPTSASHVATKEYVDGLASGLDPKQSVQVATTATLAGAVYATSPSNGQLTSVALVIDGRTLLVGDRVLVKNQVDQKQNGIYEVTVVGASATLTRATDQDGSPAAEVSGGNFTFVESGTAAGTGYVLQGTGILTLNTDNLSWVQFSDASAITAGVGLTQNGNAFDLDYSGLTDTVIASGDVISFGDTSDTNSIKSRSIGNILADLNVVQLGAFSSSAFVVRTADDVYAERTIEVSGAGDREGLVILNGNGATGNPTIGLDIIGNTASTEDLAGTDSFLAYNISTGANENFTFDEMVSDLNLVTDPGAGLIKSDGLGGFTATAIAVNGVGALDGLVVTGETVGLDINGLPAIASLAVTDKLAAYDASGLANGSVTVQQIADLAASAASGNDITQGDSSVVVTDAGTGTIVTTVDGGVVSTATASGTVFNSATISSLTAGQVVFAGTAGLLSSEAGFTYSSGTDTLSAVNIDATSALSGGTVTADNLTSGRVVLAGAAGLLGDSVDLTFNGTNLVVGGTAGLTVAGNGTVTGTLTSTAGLVSSNLTVAGGVTFSDASGVLSEEAAFVYNSATNTLTVENLDGVVSADFGNINISGNTISSTDLNGNIILAPNGTGEVVIGSAGAGQIVADDNENLTLSGGSSASATAAGDIILNGGDSSSTGNGGDVILQAGSSTGGVNGDIKLLDAAGNEIAEFLDGGIANAENHISVTAGAAGVAPSISSNSTGATDANIDIGFVLKGTGVLKVTAGSGNYEDNVTADDDIPNKAYVDALVAGAVAPGTVGSVTAVVPLNALATVAIGSIPANATILRAYIKMSVASDAATTVTIGDATNGAASYMAAAENDPQAAEIFVADGLLVNGGTAVTANAVVGGTAGTVGSATVVVEYRNV